MTIRLDLDLAPPTVNHMYRSTGGGRKALTDEAQTFRALVAVALRGATPPPPTARLALKLWLTLPTRRRSDLDNRIKATQDAIALALGIDDTRIDELYVRRMPPGPARTVAVLEEVTT